MKIQDRLDIRTFKRILLIIILSMGFGCKKFLEIPAPKTQLVNTTVFANDAGAIAAQSAIYAGMAYLDNFFWLNFDPSYSSDEFINFNSDNEIIQLSHNALLSNNSRMQSTWLQGYNYIFQSNAVIEGLAKSSGVSGKVKQQLTGEAEFTRAFWYFYLTNLFGDVPLVTSTNYQQNATAARTPQSQVYDQIIIDLKDAENKLSDNFLGADAINSTSDRVRPTKWAAAALLARVYLYNKKWADAEIQSSMVIANVSTFSLQTDLNKVFLINNEEAIWQVQAGNSIYNTVEGIEYIPFDQTSPPPFVGISTALINSFESGDQRKTNWIANYSVGSQTYYYPYKYKSGFSTTVTENETVLRLAEQYLIHAEAQAQGAGNQTSGAIADLNVIRKRAGLSNYSGSTDVASVLAAILHERQVELFSEFGHRWLDLKRTSNIDAVMKISTPAKGGSTWNSYQQFYPIPISEIKADPKLTQNQGY